MQLDGKSLPARIYGEFDLATLEDQLLQALANSNTGELDGHEIGPAGATLFLYDLDSEALFGAIELVLRGYPLCKDVRVEIRRGGPGAPHRYVRL